LLGGVVGVELVKRVIGAQGSSGDAFALPLIVGIAIGRIGCFLSGLDDHTYGNPTSLPWAIDFGDGVARHPTQLYEIAFLLVLGALLHWRRGAFDRPGDRFRAFMIAYLGFRLAVDFIKPMPMIYLGALSGIQLLCLAGLLYYHRDILRIARVVAWGETGLICLRQRRLGARRSAPRRSEDPDQRRARISGEMVPRARP
jgi:prolipoprotein diacylglyceryltransferase